MAEVRVRLITCAPGASRLVAPKGIPIAITQCPGGILRRRGFMLELRLKEGCVVDVHVERHDTGP